jgi:hypothetical protein
MKTRVLFKISSISLLTYSALVQIVTRETWWFIQNVNLIFHEAGHIIFMFFGETLAILGGSLLEILIPVAVTLHFIFSKQYFSAAFSSWWTATALLSVSIYASDARERLLPLITNDTNTHDWFNLLSKYNLLKYDDLVGYLFWCGAIMSVVAMLYLATKDKDIRHSFNQ